MNWFIEHILILMLVLGTLLSFLWLLLNRERLKMQWYVALLLAVLHTVLGVGSVKLIAFFESGFDPSGFQNMSLYGAIFFLPIAYYWGAKLTKRELPTIFDLFTICVIFCLATARVNCLFSGCCYGKVIPNTTMRWPTREVEILFYLVILLVFIWKIRSNRFPVMVFPLYMATYGLFRFIIEFFRVSDHTFGVFHISHIWSILAFLIGFSILLEQKSRMKKKQNTRRRKSHV